MLPGVERWRGWKVALIVWKKARAMLGMRPIHVGEERDWRNILLVEDGKRLGISQPIYLQRLYRPNNPHFVQIGARISQAPVDANPSATLKMAT
jgi:hypothetical protein